MVALAPADFNVCLFDGVSDSGISAFEEAGFKVRLFPDSLPEDELKEVLKTAHLVGVRSKTKLTADVLAGAENLIAIGRYGIGVNNIDLGAAAKVGAAVFNGPFSSTRSVAELVVGQIFALFRKTAENSRKMHNGEWPKSAQNCFELRGKTLGLIGYGNISAQVSVMVEALGMKVVYSDVRTVLPMGRAKQVSFDEVLEQSDVISLHVPGLPSTKNMINENSIGKMKDGACVINTSRGTVVDVDAVKSALESGKLGGAALDVFRVEPKSKKEEFVSVLRGVQNVILTPHIGGATEESQEALGAEVSGKLIKCATLADTVGALNFPELMQGPVKGCRVVVVHENKPGSLTGITEIIAGEGINVEAETLRTKGDLGVVSFDLSACLSDAGLNKIEEFEATISVRNVA